MSAYKITLTDDTVETITATRMHQDGSGLYLYDGDEQVAYYTSGQVKSAKKVTLSA